MLLAEPTVVLCVRDAHGSYNLEHLPKASVVDWLVKTALFGDRCEKIYAKFASNYVALPKPDQQWFDEWLALDSSLAAFTKVERINLEKKRLEFALFASIRLRATEICDALHELHLDALCMSDIVIQSLLPDSKRVPFHLIWNLVTAVKHYHQRHLK